METVALAPANEHALEVEQRLTRMETILEPLAAKVNTLTDSVGNLMAVARGDRKLVKGFVLALTVLWGVAQFVIPLVRPDSTDEVLRVLKEEIAHRVKSLEERLAEQPR